MRSRGEVMGGRFTVLAALVLTAGCSTDDAPLAATAPSEATTFLQSEQPATAGFQFLPPLGTARPVVDGTWDLALEPTVRVCEWTGEQCARVVASFRGRAVTLNAAEGFYSAEWRVDPAMDKSRRYRVEVLTGTREVGHVDIVLTGPVGAPTGQVAVPVGKPLFIRFRVYREIAAVIDSRGAIMSLPAWGVLRVPAFAAPSPIRVFFGTSRIASAQAPFGTTAPGFEDVLRDPTDLAVRYEGAVLDSTLQLNLHPAHAGTPFVQLLSRGGENALRYVPVTDASPSPGSSVSLEPGAFWTSPADPATREVRLAIGGYNPRATVRAEPSPGIHGARLPSCGALGSTDAILSPLPRPGLVDPKGFFLAARPQSKSGVHLGSDLEDGSGVGGAAVYAGESGDAQWRFHAATNATYGNYGYGITIRHADGTETFYAHLQPDTYTPTSGPTGPLSAIPVGKTVRVTKGQLIGYVGISGRVNIGPNDEPPHVHVEYRDPRVVQPWSPFTDLDACREFIDTWTFQPQPVQLTLGSAQAVTAVARNATGVPISGLFVDWSSGDPTKLSVDVAAHGASNTARGLSPGSTHISAASGGSIGTVTAHVGQPGTGARLRFLMQPPATSMTGPYMSLLPAIQVAVTDQFGNVVPTATDNITISLGNNPPTGAVLGGTRTVAAVQGVATFSTLRLNLPGAGYTLLAADATTPAVMPATSSAFIISTVGMFVPSSHLANYLSFGGSTLAHVVVNDFCLIQPEMLVQTPKYGGPVTTLASGLICPRGVVNDGSRVYWIDGGPASGAIRYVAVAGGPITTLATGIVNAESQMISDGSNLYFVSRGAGGSGKSIRRISRGGGPIVDLVTESTQGDMPFAVSVGSVFYWTGPNNGLDGVIKKVSVSGGVASALTTNSVSYASDIVVTGGKVYWSNVGLFNVGTAAVGALPTTLVSSNGTTSFAVDIDTDGSSLYVVDQVLGLVRYNLSNFANMNHLAPGAYYTFALDDQSVYFPFQATNPFRRGIGKVLK